MSRLAIDRETLAELGWEAVTRALAGRCATAGAELRAEELDFAPSLEKARERVTEIGEARRLNAQDAALPFAGITDVQTAAKRAEKGAVLAPEELVAVADAARGLSSLRRHLAHHRGDAPRLAARAAGLADLTHVYEPIADCFEDGPRLADHASDALGPLRRKVASLAAELDSRAQSLLDDPDLSRHLQDRFTTQRDDRYVVPVKVSSQAWVKGIVHGTSQSGQSVFIEPEAIVDLNNRLVLAEHEVAGEERRILSRLSGYVGEDAEAIQRGLSVATDLDLIAAGARLSDDLDASPPALEPGAELHLRRAQNPQMVLMGRPCVPNDIAVEARTILLISGPNAGGKTVALKTAGLAVAMAHAGLHVAADEGASIPWLKAVHAHLGDAQSVDRDLSTFSAQAADFNHFLRDADEHVLLLFDEIAVGTDPEQGAALAQAVLEAFADRGVSAIVTTHYERLKTLPPRDDRFANASVGFDVDAMQPTFELHLGLPGSSGAFAVARRLGLPEPLIARAEELAGASSTGVETLLSEVAAERDAIGAERRAIEQVRAEADSARAEVEGERRALREARRTLERQESAEAVASLRRARDEIDRVRAELKRAERRDEVAEAERRIDRAARKVAAQRGPGPPEGAPVPPDALEVGSEVFVPRFGSRGRVVEPPVKGKVRVQIGALRSQISLEELTLDAGSARTSATRSERAPDTAQAGSARNAPEPAAPRTPDSTLDLRGLRVEEALGELDRFLDQSLLAGRKVVYVLHGHGTGALRRAVREHMADHPGAVSWRSADPGEGGDGVTRICLEAS